MRARTVKVKISRNAMRSKLAHPYTPLGGNIREVRYVPPDVSNADLLRLWDQVVDAPWHNGAEGRLSFKFSELGAGGLIRE
jgi:hypothetical protein